MENINLQLYSFGMESQLSLLDKIKLTGEMGYTGVEFASGYDDIPCLLYTSNNDNHNKQPFQHFI